MRDEENVKLLKKGDTTQGSVANSRRFTRREFMQLAGMAAAAAAAARCAPATEAPTATATPAATEAPAATATPAPTEAPTVRKPVTLRLNGWTHKPEAVREDLDVFEKENPDIKVEFEDFPFGEYNDKMVTLFAAGKPPDVMYVHETVISSWATAEFIRPIDDMPGAMETASELYDWARDLFTVNGHFYGFPYFAGCCGWAWNGAHLDQVGMNEEPRLLSDLKDQCMAVKEAGIVEYPLLLGLTIAADFWMWWAMLHGAGAALFDDDLNPLFPDQETVMLELLTWLRDAMQTWQILDPVSIEYSYGQVREAFAGGVGSETSLRQYEFKYMKDPEVSLIVDTVQVGFVPTLHDPSYRSSVAYANLYGVSSTTEYPEAAYRLAYFLGAKNKAGELFCAPRWFLRSGLGFAWPALWDDPVIVESVKPWGDVELLKQQRLVARTRKCANAPWFVEWDAFTQGKIQEAILDQVEPEAALQASKDKWNQLKAEFA
jgi:multiple sugar transport system substrate-binding protein